jgi:MFS family permease
MGTLLDRLGPRAFFPAGGLLILAGYLLSSRGSELWHLLVFYGVIATIGESIISSFTTAANLVPWFPRARGRMLGLADAGSPLGSLVFLPLAQLLISTTGWRNAFWILGLLYFLLVVPGNLLFQRRPPAGPTHTRAFARTTHAAAAVFSGSTAAGDSPASGTWPPRAILLRPPLWFLMLTRLLSTLGRHMIRVHLVAFMLLAGYGPFAAATAIASAGLVGLVGRPLSGAFSDYAGREVIYTMGEGMHILAVVILIVLGDGQSLWPIFLFAGVLGLSDGISGLMVASKAADLFPVASLGSVMGLAQMGRGIGVMVGPVIGGLLFDAHGDYAVAFPLAMALSFLAVGSMWAARFTAGRTN